VSRIAAGIAAFVLAAPSAARACAVCTGQDSASTQLGFLMGTIFLSVLPLVLLGGLLLFIRARVRKRAAEEAAGVIRLPERADARRTASRAPAPRRSASALRS
jgi:cbb3-type cytochrome oxidase subunit 3